jgi:hypothetical protein
VKSYTNFGTVNALLACCDAGNSNTLLPKNRNPDLLYSSPLLMVYTNPMNGSIPINVLAIYPS